MIYTDYPKEPHTEWSPLSGDYNTGDMVTIVHMGRIQTPGSTQLADNFADSHEVDVAYCAKATREDAETGETVSYWKPKSGVVHLGFQDSVTLRTIKGCTLCITATDSPEEALEVAITHGRAQDFIPNLTPFRPSDPEASTSLDN